MTIPENKLLKARAIVGIDSWAAERGVDFSRVEEEFSIDRRHFHDDDAMMAGATMLRIMKRVSELTQCPWLGLALAQNQSLEFLGPFALLLETAPNLQQGLEAYVHYQKMQNPMVTWSLQADTAELAFCLAVGNLPEPYRRLAVDLSLGQAWRLSQHATNQRVGLERVELKVGRPANRAFYQQYFQALVYLNSEWDALVFKSEEAKWPLERHDEQIHTLIHRHVLGKGVPCTLNLSEQVQGIIRTLLRSGNCSIEQVAALFACDKRTLQRHLKTEGGSYQELLDKVRFELAQEYMSSRGFPLSQVAVMVGFSGASNFTRAFRKQLGVTPRQWRQRQGFGNHSSLASRASI
jgi:AraC-like DNA-binding protein